MSVTCTATLSVRAQTVLYLPRLLHAGRRRRGTRSGTRTLSCFKQAVLVIRWLPGATGVRQLAAGHAIGKTTACVRLHEGTGVLAAQAPNLHGVLLGRALLPGMQDRRFGRIVHIDSEVAHRPPPGRSAYAAAKNAQIGLTLSWARELAPFGQRIVVDGGRSLGSLGGQRIEPTGRPCVSSRVTGLHRQR